LADLRKFALIAFVISTLSILFPFWNSVTTTMSLVARNPHAALRSVPLTIIVSLAAASVLVFYYALFRNQDTLRVPPRIRPLALGGAIAIALSMAAGLPQTWGPLRAGWIAVYKLNWGSGGTALSAIAHDRRFIGSLILGLGECSNVAAMLVLIALFRQPTEEQSEETVPVSRLLNAATRAAVLLLGLWAAFNLVRLLASPYTYFVVRNVALENRLKPPPLAHIVSRANIEFLASVGQFAAPYIVFKSLPGYS
jgi:hypothetical protein